MIKVFIFVKKYKYNFVFQISLKKNNVFISRQSSIKVDVFIKIVFLVGTRIFSVTFSLLLFFIP